MADVLETLAALQFGDSFFPSGAMAFSWGLETLRADGLVNNGTDVDALVAGQLEHRWATFDRPAVVAAYRAAEDLDRVCAIDREVDAATLAREAREGARRIGASLLKVHTGLGTRGAAGYHALVMRGEAFAQMPVVQGFVGQASGLGEDSTCAMSGYQVAAAMVSAALRLALLGHMEAQSILQAQRARVAELVSRPLPQTGAIHAFAPAVEIAMMRHETGSGRMFAN